MSRFAPVAVVGGGPCGLMTALLLARQGIEVELFERNRGTSAHPKAMGITRRTAEILRQAGLLDAFVSASLPLEGRSLQIWSRTLAGEELGRIPLAGLHSDLTPCSPLHCPQTQTERILAEALAAEPNAKIHFGLEAKKVTMGEEGGEISLEDGKTCVFEWAVAADGASSPLRKQFEVPSAGPGDMGHFLNVMFRAPYGKPLENRPALLYSALWQNGFEVFVAVNGDDLWLMHHFLQPGETAKNFSHSALEEIIRAASGLPRERVEVLGAKHWVMSPKLAGLFRTGRLFFVGDAAARLSPTGGLGLNTGLQSAHNLAWKLAAVVRGEAAPGLLESYQAERRASSAALMRVTNQHAGEIFAIVAEAANGHWDAVRKLVAHSRRAGPGLGIDLGFSYEQGAFLPDGSPPAPVADPINDYLPSARPGRRAPHLPAECDGRKQSLLDFFGGDFVLLAGKGGDGWRELDGRCAVRQSGKEFVCAEFEKAYGINADGAVLVRPDGVVGARWASSPSQPFDAGVTALRSILRPG